MIQELMNNNPSEKRTEHRIFPENFYSVEFSPQGLESPYQFKIRDVSSTGMCIIVREDSEVLQHLHEGQILQMKYYGPEASGSFEKLKTIIQHITRDDQGRFKGHFLVGLSIVEDNYEL